MPSPVGGEVGEEVVDGPLRADVDAARRLVGDHHPRLAEQHPREQHLLLVAAGERAHRSRVARAAHAAALEHVAAQRSAVARRPDDAERAQRPSRDRVAFSIDERPRIRPVVLARLGDHRERPTRGSAAGCARAAGPRSASVARTRPARRRRSPARARCARRPTRPARPRISPARSSKLAASTPGAVEVADREHDRRVRREAGLRRGNVAVSGRPSIASTSDASVSAAAGAVLTISARPAAR